jgi:molybdate/tungstate transport system ATP-binding protein
MLELAGVAKSYDGFAFGPVGLTVDDEVLAVLGPSGSGKTTLVSVVAGVTPPDAGSISLDGRSLVGRPPEDRGTGLVFQDGALFPHMTARENVAYAAESPARVGQFADLLEIEDVLDRRPRALSGGERQRVAFARALAADPDALLLDEPLSSLDAPIRRRLREELHGLFDTLDIPVVYITHDQRAATSLGDRIAVFRDGAVEQVGPPSAVRYRPETPFVARFTGNENVFEAEVRDRNGEGVFLRAGDATFRARDGEAADEDVTACVHPSRVRIHTPDAGDTADGNTVPGTVRRWLNEGDSDRVVVALDGADLDLTAAVPPAAVEDGTLASGAHVRVSVPPDAVHLF